MLGNLIKHEFKATSRILVPLYIVLICISIINRFLFQSGINEGIFAFFTGFLMITQILLIVAILITTVLFMVIRFYKNLLSDEGYLMFTLPVNTHQLIISKLLVTIIWIFVSIIAILSSLYIVFATSGSIGLIIREIQRAFAELKASFGGNSVLLIIDLILMLLLSAVTNMLMIYSSIAIGQLFSKHRIVASFVSYVVIYNIMQLIMVLVLVILSYILSGNLNFAAIMPQVIFPVIIIITSLTCVAFYITTYCIFEKKLNLE